MFGVRAYCPLDALLVFGFASKVRTSVIEYVASCPHNLQRAMKL
jgi:hypothetical protein